MTSQQHIIKQQIIELQISSDLKAFELQNELSRLYHSQIVPLIESYCNDLSDPDTIYRIDSLEIDIGTIYFENWTSDFVEKVAAALREKLLEEMGTTSSQSSITLPNTLDQVSLHNQINSLNDDKLRPDLAAKPINLTDAHLELFCYFIDMGFLPWWSESLSQQELEDCLKQLLETSPDILKVRLTIQLQQVKSLQRLIYQFSDTILTDIVSLWIPNFSQWGHDYFNTIQKLFITLKSKKDITSQQLRLDFWQGLFSIILLNSDSNLSSPLEFIIGESLYHLAMVLNVEVSSLLQKLQVAIKSENNNFPQILTNLINQEKITLNTWLNNDQRKNIESLSYLLTELTNLDNYQDFSTALQSKINTLSTQISTILLTPSSVNISLNSLLNKIEMLLKELENNKSLFNESKIRSLKAIAQSLNSPQSSLNSNEFNLSDNSFSESEEIYIQNAGLVLLWPFLDRFFATLNLVQNNQFINLQTAKKATLLLQYLVDSSLVIPEHLLPLNKILCGLDILEPVEINLNLSEEEDIECNDLLLAIIQNWSALKNTTPQGFQQAFLQRNGILTSYNDNWRLQVEQVTYDILLDQLPWTITVIQLPWMDQFISVEWLTG